MLQQQKFSSLCVIFFLASSYYCVIPLQLHLPILYLHSFKLCTGNGHLRQGFCLVGWNGPSNQFLFVGWLCIGHLDRIPIDLQVSKGKFWWLTVIVGCWNRLRWRWNCGLEEPSPETDRYCLAAKKGISSSNCNFFWKNSTVDWTLGFKTRIYWRLL